jgi:threonine/homoserine/homoserine lactone efflux protein
MKDLLPILLFCFSSSLTPGPNNFMIMNSGLRFGVRKSLPHYLGICFGFAGMALIVALGLGAIFLKYMLLQQILKIVGAVYMLYLAWKIVFSQANAKIKNAGKPISFIQAVLFQWINPKAWLMTVGAIAIFSVSNHYLTNAIFISVLFLIFCLPCVGVWMMFGASLQKILKNATQQRYFNIAMAICLVASIAMIFFD